MFDVVGIGASSVDFVYRLPSWPRPDAGVAKLRIAERSIRCGGQTATAMAACARLGLRAAYLGAVGDDGDGGRVPLRLNELGVDISHVIVRHGGRSGYAVILVDEASGERVVLWERDPALALQDREIPASVIAGARLVHVDDVDEPAAFRAAQIAREAGVPVTSDIDRVTPRTRELLALVTYPIVAEQVPVELTGERDPRRALLALAAALPGRLLCVTLGPHGAMARAGDRIIAVPGHRVKAVDTTGAGDVFRAGFIYGVLHEWPIDRIVEFANATAAVSCTKPGAIDGVPDMDEAMRIMAQGRRSTAQS
jgi:sugar/nucleoside kinase (ribokinase family)